MTEEHQKTKKSQSTPSLRNDRKPAIEYLPNPVLELIVEARVSASGWNEETPNRLHALLNERLPNIESEKLVGSAGVVRAMEDGTIMPHSPKVQIWNDERTELLQFGPGAIIANALNTSSWDVLSTILEAGLKAYIKTLPSARVTHLSFRMNILFDLVGNKSSNVELDKFFNLYVGFPMRFREIDGMQVSFQKLFKSGKAHAEHARNPIRLEVELRSLSKSDLTALTNGMGPATSKSIPFLLDIKTSCDYEAELNADLICATAGRLHLAGMEALRSTGRSALLKKYHWQGT